VPEPTKTQLCSKAPELVNVTSTSSPAATLALVGVNWNVSLPVKPNVVGPLSPPQAASKRASAANTIVKTVNFFILISLIYRFEYNIKLLEPGIFEISV
jgi:hypothetical protein